MGRDALVVNPAPYSRPQSRQRPQMQQTAGGAQDARWEAAVRRMNLPWTPRSALACGLAGSAGLRNTGELGVRDARRAASAGPLNAT